MKRCTRIAEITSQSCGGDLILSMKQNDEEILQVLGKLPNIAFGYSLECIVDYLRT